MNFASPISRDLSWLLINSRRLRQLGRARSCTFAAKEQEARIQTAQFLPSNQALTFLTQIHVHIKARIFAATCMEQEARQAAPESHSVKAEPSEMGQERDRLRQTKQFGEDPQTQRRGQLKSRSDDVVGSRPA